MKTVHYALVQPTGKVYYGFKEVRIESEEKRHLWSSYKFVLQSDGKYYYKVKSGAFQLLTENDYFLVARKIDSEPSSAAVWQDEYLQGRVDLSSVNFIMTANEITKLSGPLLSRTRQITVDYLTPKSLQHAIPRMLVEIAESYGISSKTTPIMDDTVAKAITRKCRDLRKLKLAVQSWLLFALKQEDSHTGHMLH